ncbi:hypothetical protein [Branchiibius sp. NY16-3462-2]|uniref:hypothetical protein n=1 Tax=Branchiibius sp. NY16-3462-2 TaxID=1807500 RepID=UPI000792F35F|nr:hypothetical protein [Branchiibius sp. NY16-3462-2]KYH43244.1 hypothetical protein AZH51_12885 [Branchiibius sp. NY16-3462-2]
MPHIKKPRNAAAEVDLTRKTPWGTEYRVARTATAGVACDQRWVTICLEHNTQHGSDTLRTACTAGTRAAVAEWCNACAVLRDGPPEPVEPAPATNPARKRTTPVRKPQNTRAASAGK